MDEAYKGAAISMAEYLWGRELDSFLRWAGEVGTEGPEFRNKDHVFFDVCEVLGLDPMQELEQEGYGQ